MAEAARLLGKARRTIERWADSGRLPSQRQGRRLLVDIGGQEHVKAVGIGGADGDLAATVAELRATVATQQAAIERLEAVLTEIRQERDYLRQVHAMSVSTTTTRQIEAPKRSWWTFWQR